MTIETLACQGRKKIHNGLAAIDSSKLRMMRNEALRQCFTRLDEMRYRREFIARIHGKTFINDAASRTINATWYTLESAEGPIIWIAQGGATEIDYSKLVVPVSEHVRMIICLGNDDSAIKRQLGEIVPVVAVTDMREAVMSAFYNAIEGSTVIYSPAAPNNSTAERNGQMFNLEVNEL